MAGMGEGEVGVDKMAVFHPPLNPLPPRGGGTKRERLPSREGKITHLK